MTRMDRRTISPTLLLLARVLVLVLVPASCFLASEPALAQGSRHDGIVLSEQGKPVAGATITVCTEPANITLTPCTPLANLFTDSTMATPAANPLTSDGLGNFHFYAAPGTYAEQINGLGVAPYTIPDVLLPANPSNAQFGSITATSAISALTLTLGGNLAVGGNANITGSLTAGSLAANLAGTSNAQLKPFSGDGILWVSPSGSDTNDGKSAGTAMATIAHAACSLPGGNCAANTVGSGTIYFFDGSQASATSGCGFWLMGTLDPNYASPPPCWLKTTSGTSGIWLVGIPKAAYGPNGLESSAALNGGSTADRNHPLIWLSGTNGSYNFENIAGGGSSQRVVVIGECSNNSRNGSCNVAGVNFDNDRFAVPAVAGYGPSWDITGQSFWLQIKNCSGLGTDTVNAPTSDNAAAMLIDGRTGGRIGLITIDMFNSSEGGIKIYAGSGGADVSISHVTTEGEKGEPAVEFAATGTTGSGNVQADLNDIQVADFTAGPAPAVENDSGSGDIVVQHAFGGTQNILGAATVISQYEPTSVGQSVSPQTYGQDGFMNGWVFGKRNDVQRNFGLAPVRFANLASTAPSGWSATQFAGTTTFTQSGFPAPDGTTSAAQASSTASSPNELLLFFQQNRSIAVGDTIVAGAWVRSPGANGYVGSATNPLAVAVNGSGDTATGGCTGDAMQGDGEWVWNTCVYQITAAATSPAFIEFYAAFNSANSVQAYAPVLNYIPAGTLSTNEINAYAAALKSYDSSCAAGTVCGLRFDSVDIPTLLGPVVDSSSGASGVTFRNSGSTVWTTNASSSAFSWNFNAHNGETAMKLAQFGGQAAAGLIDNFGMAAGFVPVTESSGTVAFDAGLGDTFEVTLNANVTSSTLSNAQPGQWFNFIVCQPASGGPFTFTWPSNIRGAMMIGTTAGKCSAQSFAFDGTSAFATSSGTANQ